MPAVLRSLSLASIQELEFEEDSSYSYSCSDSEDEGSLFSIDFNSIPHKTKPDEQMISQDVRVYHVAVDLTNSKSSMDALLWTLRQAVLNNHLSSIKAEYHIKLVHVFSPIRFIPSPLGKLPISTVSQSMVKKHLAQEREQMAKLLEIYVKACSTAMVKVGLMLVESDTVAEAILDLIPTHNIKYLVVGTTKSNLRNLRSKKGSGVTNQILQNASPETSLCDIKIICKGTEVVIDQLIGAPSPRSSISVHSLSTLEDQDQEVPVYVKLIKNMQHVSRG